MPSLILTVIGPDRPGLVRALAQAVAAHGGSWLESRMARLAGQFAGIVLVEAPDALLTELHALESEGLRIVVHPGETAPGTPVGEHLTVEVVGNDRPGIVRDVARVLAEHGVNIEELITGVVNGSFSGETLFKATAVRARAERGRRRGDPVGTGNSRQRNDGRYPARRGRVAPGMT